MKLNEIQRIKKAQEKYNMFHDDYKNIVETKLGLIYKSFSQLGLDVQLHHSTNLYKMIINNISKVYDYGINRTFENEDFNEIYEELNVDKVMKQTNTYMNAFNDVILQVGWDDEEEELKLIIRLPHKTKVEWVNQKVKSVEYFIEFDTETKKEKWAYWTKTEHYYKIYQGSEFEKELPEGNNEGKNPFKILPFVFMNNGWRDESFWDNFKGDDLFNSTTDISIHLSFLNHIIKTQSFKQIVGKGDNLEALNGSILDPLSVMFLEGNNTELDVLDLQANYEQLWKVLNEQANSLATSYNISPSSFRMTGQVSSGFSLQIENLKLDTFVKSQQEEFIIFEKQLFKIIKKVLGSTTNIDFTSNVVIDFNSPTYPMSAKEQIEIREKEIELGLNNQINIIKEEKEIDDKTATETFNNNLNIRNKSYQRINEDEEDIITEGL